MHTDTSATTSSEAAPNTAERFGFGENWARYIRQISEANIIAATSDLAALLTLPSLTNLTLLDIGSGSGIHSLAAMRLGATVTSFDYDEHSVACTRALREQFAGEAAARWNVVGQGSILDETFVASLGYFDVVYSWGVLHHTGAMRRAIASRVTCVTDRTPRHRTVQRPRVDQRLLDCGQASIQLQRGGTFGDDGSAPAVSWRTNRGPRTDRKGTARARDVVVARLHRLVGGISLRGRDSARRRALACGSRLHAACETHGRPTPGVQRVRVCEDASKLSRRSRFSSRDRAAVKQFCVSARA